MIFVTQPFLRRGYAHTKPVRSKLILTTLFALCFTILSFPLAFYIQASNEPALTTSRSEITPKDPLRIMVLGDSISAGYGFDKQLGWVNLLRQKLHPSVQVINASVSGETTGGALRRLPALLTLHNPNIVIVELGGNDALRGFPIKVAHNNLHSIITLIQKNTGEALLTGIQMPPNYGPRYTEAFASIYPELSQQLQVSLIPNFLQRVALQPGMMQADRIHPSAKAQPILLEAIESKLMPLLEAHQHALKTP